MLSTTAVVDGIRELKKAITKRKNQLKTPYYVDHLNEKNKI
jgi:hypothetical protein